MLWTRPALFVSTNELVFQPMPRPSQAFDLAIFTTVRIGFPKKFSNSSALCLLFYPSLCFRQLKSFEKGATYFAAHRGPESFAEGSSNARDYSVIATPGTFGRAE